MGVQSMTVYVLSTSQSQTQLVTLYLSQLNDIYDQLRVFVLNESHFTSVTVPPLPLPTKAAPKTSISLEVPLDRLAIVNAHACQYGLPLLTIFEHNTLLHHYIIDSEGTIVTAGISDTIEQTLHHARQRLHPSLPSKKKRNGHSDDGKRLETCLRQLFHSKQQLFSGTVEEQFVQQTLREKILGLESVVQDYLLQFGSISDDEEHLTVVVSSSNPLLSQLLPNRHNFSWIRRKPTVLPYQLGSIVNKEDNDVAASIACVLRQKDKARKHQQQRDGGRYENQAAQVEQIAPTPVAVTTNLNANANKVLVVDLDSILIGCRAAQEFREPDEYGDMMYRGTVVKAIGATATPQMGYKISYDDGDATEPESWKELHGMFCNLSCYLLVLLTQLMATFCLARG